MSGIVTERASVKTVKHVSNLAASCQGCGQLARAGSLVYQGRVWVGLCCARGTQKALPWDEVHAAEGVSSAFAN